MKKVNWNNGRDFYDLHSKDIFSRRSFYNSGLIGNSNLEFLIYIMNKARILPVSRVVDLGCGSGYLAFSLGQFCECVGISNSEQCIRQARDNFPKGKFELANMENYRFPNATHFIALESLVYADLQKTLSSVYESLVPGGLFFINDILRAPTENEFEKENRMHCETYWKVKISKSSEIITLANQVGFNLEYFEDVTGSVHGRSFAETLKLNKIPYKVPYPDTGFLHHGEFLFVK